MYYSDLNHFKGSLDSSLFSMAENARHKKEYLIVSLSLVPCFGLMLLKLQIWLQKCATVFVQLNCCYSSCFANDLYENI